MKYTVKLRNPASGTYWYETIEADNITHAQMAARNQYLYYVEQIKLESGQQEPEHVVEQAISSSNDPDAQV